MTFTLAQIAPMVFSGLAATAMVRLGASKKMLVVRRPKRCAACGIARTGCRCAA